MPPPSVPGSQAATYALARFSSRFCHSGRPESRMATTGIFSSCSFFMISSCWVIEPGSVSTLRSPWNSA